ncbi:MAG: response regulator [Polyangiaceae bacterium]
MTQRPAFPSASPEIPSSPEHGEVRLGSGLGGAGGPGDGQRTGSGAYPTSGVARRRILVVEDDEPTRRLLAITLRRSYDVTVAADGVEGLESASTPPFPDLIITDVMMPRLDGVMMVREIKRRDPSRKVPIIFLTAKGGAADVAAGIGVGARHYLVKPVRLQALEEMVKSILRRS